MADLKITIDATAVAPETKATDKLEIKHTPTAGKLVLLITDKAGKQLYKTK